MVGGYRLYDCNSKKVVINSDVIFYESRSLNWENIVEDTDSKQQELKIEIEESTSKSANDCETADHETLVHVDQNWEGTTDNRPKRTRAPSSRLQGFEVHTDDIITDDGELLPSEVVHAALFVDVETFFFAQAIKERK